MIAQGVCCYFSCVSWDRKVPGAQQSFLFVLMQLYNQAKFHIDSRMIRYRPHVTLSCVHKRVSQPGS